MQPLVSSAQSFAYAKHAGQNWGVGPYEDHLFHVYRMLAAVEAPEHVLAAAFLHDVVEDTDTTLEEVRTLFGEEVASLVRALTKPKGVSRRAGAEKYYAQIASTPFATTLKLADRISNVEKSWFERDSRLFMYRREYPLFREKLRVEPLDPTHYALWDSLDRNMCWEERLTSDTPQDSQKSEVKNAIPSGTGLS